ncbi:MAG: penicillin-binding transpeptidase domain-containing protein [Acidimicrobiia bacterium]
MNRPLRRLAAVLFVAFAILAAGTTYAQVLAGPGYRDDNRNTRTIIDEARRERGAILSADGVVLAESVADPSDPRSFRRRYPQGPTYAHVVGVAATILADRGLEAELADTLESGRDATISGLFSALTGDDLRARSVRLTIDDRLQQAAVAALGGQKGAIVAIDPTTGAVLAMVSAPAFDPNGLIGLTTDLGNALENDPDRPLLNRAIQETYAPGSTFKTVTAAAAIEGGGAGADSLYPNPAQLTLPGSTATISNFNGGTCGPGDEVTLAVALIRSCNTVFGVIGMETGAGDLIGTAEAFGFNDDIPFALRGATSAVPPAESLASDLPAVAQTALGQRDVRATPLQMALVASAIANGGVVMTPYVVDEIIDADGDVVEETAPTEWRRATSPATARVIADLLREAVETGTGRNAAVSGVVVAGKTGTAEVPDGPPHPWFIGFALMDTTSPIALAVVVESGGDLGDAATGGGVAAPIARQLIETWVALIS